MSGEDKTPAWVWIIGFLALLSVLASMDQRSGTEGDGPHDDGCSSGVSPMGCFP